MNLMTGYAPRRIEERVAGLGIGLRRVKACLASPVKKSDPVQSFPRRGAKPEREKTIPSEYGVQSFFFFYQTKRLATNSPRWWRPSSFFIMTFKPQARSNHTIFVAYKDYKG